MDLDQRDIDTILGSPSLDDIIQERIGHKYDQNKPIAGALQDMGLALLEVSKLLTFGEKKYARSSWLHVPNGHQRYTDALMRHLLLENTEFSDPETSLGHDVAVATNALFRLELRLRRERAHKI